MSKGATDKQLKDFLEDKGIKVEEIECMTYHPDARTNTFRVAIAIADYEKALDPQVWPYRVAVRLFRPARRDREQKNMENQFGRSGGFIQPNQHRRDHRQQPAQPLPAQPLPAQQQPSKPSQEPELIEISNPFDLLGSMDDKDN